MYHPLPPCVKPNQGVNRRVQPTRRCLSAVGPFRWFRSGVRLLLRAVKLPPEDSRTAALFRRLHRCPANRVAYSSQHCVRVGNRKRHARALSSRVNNPSFKSLVLTAQLRRGCSRIPDDMRRASTQCRRRLRRFVLDDLRLGRSACRFGRSA